MGSISEEGTTLSTILCLDIKHEHQLFESILSIETGVGQITFFRFPFRETTVVKHLFGILNEERNNVVS